MMTVIPTVALVAVGGVEEESQGPFAPEVLAGPVFSRRFTGRFRNGKYVTITDYYAVIDLAEYTCRDADEFRDGGGQYDVENQVEYLVSDKPLTEDDWREVTSDYYSEFPNYRSFETVEAATASARSYAEASSAEFFTVNESWENGIESH